MADTHQIAERHYGGWRPSRPDFRDLVADTSEIAILDEVDPRAEMTPIYDQGQLGSCTANAVARVVDYDRITSGQAPVFPSREAIYFFERLIERQPLDQDTGAFGRDGFKACRKFGYVPEKEWPYSDDMHDPNYAKDPRESLPAADFVKLEHPYKAVQRGVDHFRAVLSNHQMIAFGFTVYESFESAAVARDGIVPLPSRGEKVLGGHEVVLIGYLKDQPNYGLCANSWSASWGLDGCFLMPWAYLLDHNLSSDFRTIYHPLA